MISFLAVISRLFLRFLENMLGERMSMARADSVNTAGDMKNGLSTAPFKRVGEMISGDKMCGDKMMGDIINGLRMLGERAYGDKMPTSQISGPSTNGPRT